jgi:DNA topoisomerase I
MKLLIVESPTKAKTLSRYLKGFKVIASMGHIIDLPPKRLGVEIENDFKPKYEVIQGKQKIIDQLKKEAANAKEIYIGSDPDREGEAIAYHIASLFEGREIKRVLFNEITKMGVLKALNESVTLNENLYNSQQARRILDRLVGYKMSPFLWRSVKKGLSAGRVQSVALKMIVELEKEIRAFNPVEYWTVKGFFKTDEHNIDTNLEKIKGKKIDIKTEKEASETEKRITKASGFHISSVDKKKKKESPLPPLNTSNLQQEASRKHGYTAEKIMRIAQSLYEGKDVGEDGTTGLITYMRTDSFRISQEANDSLREYVTKRFGKDYLSPKCRVYANKKGKIQDAHEAIRPTNVHLSPDVVSKHLTKDELNIYTLIWNRFVATQMKEAIYDSTVITVTDEKKEFEFRKTGSVLVFEGYRVVHKRNSKDEILPALAKDSKADLEKVEATQHFTKPSPRFSEGSLIKELEDKGVGRPSTYATIIKQIIVRNYIERMKEPKGALKPTELGELVSNTLHTFFPKIIDVGFTAQMEEDLDIIELGEKVWTDVIKTFYNKFSKVLDSSIEKIKSEGKQKLYAEEPCPKCGKRLVLRWSKKGNQPFLSCEAYPECDFSGGFENIDEKIHLKENDAPEAEFLDEKCPNCSSPLVIKDGRYGKFKACSAYPKCKTIVKEEVKVGKCPKEGCDGEIGQRRSKRGKVFFGCSNYPKCDFISWYPPIDGEKCEKCGSEYIVEKKRSGKVCQICGHKPE